MSIQHVSLVLDARDPCLTGSRKLALIALANRTNAHGECWPSQDLIAGECGISVRAMSDHLKGLEADGFITRKTKHLGKGNGSRTTYTLHLEALKVAPEEVACAEVAPANLVGCTGSTPRVTNLQEPTLSNTNVLDGVGEKDAQPPPKTEKPKAKSVRGSRMTESWSPTPKDYAFATSKGLTSQETNHEADQFRNHHIAKGTISKSWAASWRTWVNNSAKWKGERKAPGNNRTRQGGDALDRLGERVAGNAPEQDAGRPDAEQSANFEPIDLRQAGGGRFV